MYDAHLHNLNILIWRLQMAENIAEINAVCLNILLRVSEANEIHISSHSCKKRASDQFQSTLQNLPLLKKVELRAPKTPLLDGRSAHTRCDMKFNNYRFLAHYASIMLRWPFLRERSAYP